MTPQIFQIHGLVSFTLAILLLFLGKTLVQRNALLRQYCIPESVVGGFVCAAVTTLFYFGLNIEVAQYCLTMSKVTCTAWPPRTP